MYICINKCSGKTIRLRLPSGLMPNRLSAAAISSSLTGKNLHISGKQLHILFRAIRSYKSIHPEWKLVEVYSHNGKIVEIVL